MYRYAVEESAGEEESEEALSVDVGMVAHPERLNGAIALIAGGTIGAGIIALPVKTVAAGFVPSTVALTCCWAYMVLTAGSSLQPFYLSSETVLPVK